MDALSHAMESYLSNMATPVTEALSCRAISLIWDNLPIVVLDGSNLAARSGMCIASMMAGITINNAYQNQGHGLAHPMGSHWHMPHGLACAIALPFAVFDNRNAMPEKIRSIAGLLGLALPADASPKETAAAVADEILRFSKESLPAGIRRGPGTDRNSGGSRKK